ncbi:CRISPR/Cas system CSM-associated protein Csm3 (group 7 of RAMP superfamily) [Bradyrhizobium ottawaense]
MRAGTRELAECGERIGAFRHLVEHALRGRGADARQQMQNAETGDAVARVLGKAQQRQHVLDVRGVEEFQPAELDERNVAAGQLDLERA